MRLLVLSTGELSPKYLPVYILTIFSDIKPENLLFYPVPFVPSKHPKPTQPGDEDKVDEGEFRPGVGAGTIGRIKIADFGLSKVIWDSQTMTPCGTVGYTAPEIVKDERYSKSVDMWALGCVLYTVLCGFPPFYDESIQALTEKVARGEYTFLSPWWDDISSEAKDLVAHLLTVNPEKRYGIHEFLAHPWIQKAGNDVVGGELSEADKAAAQSPPQRISSQILDDLPSTAASQRRMDFRSPGAINLREVFDVGYAVHRQEEESKRRKGNRGVSTALQTLDEDFDDDEEGHTENVENAPIRVHKPSQQHAGDVASVEAQLRSTNLGGGARKVRSQRQQGYGQHSAAVAAAAREKLGQNAVQPFELRLDHATLLEKRGRRQQQQMQQLQEQVA